MTASPTRRSSARALLVALIVVGALAGASALVLQASRDDSNLPAGIDSSQYVAVKLTSGETYFGLLEPEADGFLELRRAHGVSVAPDGSGESKIAPVTQQPIEPRGSIFIPVGQITTVQPLARDSVVTDILKGRKPGPFTSRGSAYGVSGGVVTPPESSPRSKGG